MPKSTYKPKFTYKTLEQSAVLIRMGAYQKAIDNVINNSVFDVTRKYTPATLEFHTNKFQKFVDSLDDRFPSPTFNIFTKGNSKLPFLSFSSLPGKGFCPGAGECLDFCYSFNSWKYPGAFFRQAQNYILVKSHFDIVSYEFKKYVTKLYKDIPVDFRLYVDGDFETTAQLSDWMELLGDVPNANAYGYSKSTRLFNALDNFGFVFPNNYTLNISSGGIISEHEASRMLRNLRRSNGAPVVRGSFIAVDTNSKSYSTTRTKGERRAIQKWAKDNSVKKFFTCPGNCGECLTIKTPSGKKNIHACGYDQFNNMPIIIPVH